MSARGHAAAGDPELASSAGRAPVHRGAAHRRHALRARRDALCPGGQRPVPRRRRGERSGSGAVPHRRLHAHRRDPGRDVPADRRPVLGVDYRFERVAAFLPNESRYARPDGSVTPVDLDLLDGIHRQTSAHFRLVWDGRDLAAQDRQGRSLRARRAVRVADRRQRVRVHQARGWRRLHVQAPVGSLDHADVFAGQIAGQAPRFERFFAGDLHDWTPGRELGFIYTTRNPIDVFNMGIDTRALGDLFAQFELEYVWPLFRGSRVRGIKGGHLFISTGLFTIVESGRCGTSDARAARPSRRHRPRPGDRQEGRARPRRRDLGGGQPARRRWTRGAAAGANAPGPEPAAASTASCRCARVVTAKRSAHSHA